jgi:hypothetical protein
MADFAVSPKVHSWPTHSVITLSYKRSASEYYNTDTSPIWTFITKRKTPNVMSASEQGGRNGGPDPAPSQKSEAKTMWAPQNPATHRLSTPRGPYIRLINRTSSDLSTGIKRGSSHYFSRSLERGSLEKNYRLLNPQNLPLFCPLLTTVQRESHVSPKTPKIQTCPKPHLANARASTNPQVRCFHAEIHFLLLGGPPKVPQKCAKTCKNWHLEARGPGT